MKEGKRDDGRKLHRTHYDFVPPASLTIVSLYQFQEIIGPPIPLSAQMVNNTSLTEANENFGGREIA